MKRGFTLVELLVVVAIIVVLLALLMPAMDKAIYHAELAVCGAQLKAVASGGTLYGLDNRRQYPNTAFWQNYLQMDLRCAWGGLTDVHDVRLLIRGYIPGKSLLDPMVAPVDLDATQASWVQSSYNLHFGLSFPGHRGMKKIGDRWGWGTVDAGGNPLEIEFDLIASDLDFFTNNAGATVYGSHPDAMGVMANVKAQDFPSPPNSFTFSYWQLVGTDDRGPVDHQYAHDDNSVSRVTEIKPPDGGIVTDSRMERVPAYRNPNQPLWFLQLPVQ